VTQTVAAAKTRLENRMIVRGQAVGDRIGRLGFGVEVICRR